MQTASTLPPPRSSLPPPSPIVKVCSCCARTYTAAEWSAAPSIGLQDDGEGFFLRLVNCACGSTIALPHLAPCGSER